MELVAADRQKDGSGSRGLWLASARWDLTWIIGSAGVVPLSLLLVWAGISSDLMNLLVTLLVGGPHVFSTFLLTYLNPDFRRGHAPALALVGVGVATAVVFMTVHFFPVLMTFFVLAASFHVLQQNAFLADLYRGRSGQVDGIVSRGLDYAILFLSFYPIASYKLVHHDFMMGEIPILIPRAAQSETMVLVVFALFVAAMLLWIGKTVVEWHRGVLNVPKTILLVLTSGIAFLVPAAASGVRLELAFQTVNVWHSIQYLGIVWLVLARRRAEQPAPRGFLSLLAGPGIATARFYGTCLAFTAVLLGIVVLLHRTHPLDLSRAQYHYMTVFSVLFVHYAFDGVFFLVSGVRRRGIVDNPLAALR
jgi:hypothetical protein